LLVALPASAALPPSVTIGGDGACPDPAVVAADLGALSGAPIDGGTPAAKVRVRDLGDRYRVEGAGADRELADPARDCAERARAAAAVVLLALRPPTVTLPPSSPLRTHPPLRLDLEGTATFTGAPRADGDAAMLAGGASLRLALHARYVGLSLGAAALSPATMQIAMVDVRVWRAPFDLSLRGLLPLGRRVEGVGDLGVYLAVMHAAGAGLPITQSGTRLEPGVRLGLAMRAWILPRLALVAGVDALIAIQTTPLAVDSVGVIATTPRAWVGGHLGLAVRLH
jgi:hypothetical protein